MRKEGMKKKARGMMKKERETRTCKNYKQNEKEECPSGG